MEILERKNTTAEIRTRYVENRRLERTREKINTLEDKTKENIWYKAPRDETKESIENRIRYNEMF